MTTPDESTTPQAPSAAEKIALCARDLWEAYGGQWPECIHCSNRELETCGLDDWRGCDLIMQEALSDAGADGPCIR